MEGTVRNRPPVSQDQPFWPGDRFSPPGDRVAKQCATEHFIGRFQGVTRSQSVPW